MTHYSDFPLCENCKHRFRRDWLPCGCVCYVGQVDPAPVGAV